jgi:hypothetical protein
MGLFNTLDEPVFLKTEGDLIPYIEKLEKLEEKAKGETRKEIQQQIKIAQYGEAGEKQIAYELKNSDMPMYIIRDLHLAYKEVTAVAINV